MGPFSTPKMAALAASISLAMASTTAMAVTAPTAMQLPGQGRVISGAVTLGIAGGGAQSIGISGNAVISWGDASSTVTPTINATGQPAGFNIGSGASLTFAGSKAGNGGGNVNAVLNIDASGNPSQILGALTGTAVQGDTTANTTNIFVANPNGIIVGATAVVSTPGDVGLIANDLSDNVGTGFTGSASSIVFNGTGSTVDVATNAHIGAVDILVAGGSSVNVDLSALGVGGTATSVKLMAGLPQNVPSFPATNTAASVVLSGAQNQGTTVAALQSAGTASSSGTLSLTNVGTSVAGIFTNTGTLDLADGFSNVGGLTNQRVVNAAGAATFGSLVNNGQITTGGDLTTTAGGFYNNGLIRAAGMVNVTGGDLNNLGAITLGSVGASEYLSLTVQGGDLVNAGSITAMDPVNHYYLVAVTNGSVSNTGLLSNFDSITTMADTTAASYKVGADYSITNSGTMISPDNFELDADATRHVGSPGVDDTSTGSFANTGTLQLSNHGGLAAHSNNDTTLGGVVKINDGGTAGPVSATHPLGSVDLEAGGYSQSDASITTDGVLTVSTPLVTDSSYLRGAQVKLLSNISASMVNGAPTPAMQIVAGPKSATDYAVRIASGVMISADSIEIFGDQASDDPNVILQGTLAGNSLNIGRSVEFGTNHEISDLFSGPTGSLQMLGSNPSLYLNFSGRVKVAPYLNDANFRYNYLPITLAAGSNTLNLTLNPSAYTTNGTSNGLSAVNLLVNGPVNLSSAVPPANVQPGGSAVTGVDTTPNTHLVLQSTGNIATATGSEFYWPGYVYLGNISTNTDGSAAPGTLGLGLITLGNNFNNVLPGSIANGGGIHFITQLPLNMGSNTVTTNANSYVNFGIDALTQGYASGSLGGGQFYGGAQGAGNVVTYGALDPSLFKTQPPVAAR